jgi:hypothetical protein
MPDDLMYFNGIVAGSGGYSMPPNTAGSLTWR